MTTVEPAAAPPATMPEGAHPVTLPVMVVEGLETSDRRYIEPGALTVRPLPITLFAQTRSTHGAEGDAATWVVGSITEAERVPGPEVIQKSTGEPFPDGTFVWQGKGWMYPDVPAAPLKSAYEMLRDGALSGNSVDLSAVEAEFEYAEESGPNDPPDRIVTYSGSIAATTLVGQPAFQDAYAQIDGEAVAEPVLTAGATPVPAWRAAEIGDECSPCAVGDSLVADALEVDGVTMLTVADGDDFDAEDTPGATQDFSTSGMIALVPSNPNMLRVPGGDPTEELHLTLAYLGDEVDTWDPEQVAAVHRLALESTNWNAHAERMQAEARERGDDSPLSVDNYRYPAQKGPLSGGIFSHAVFNPNSDQGFDSATVYLLDGTADRGDIDELAMQMQHGARTALGEAMFPKQHAPYVPHVTAGYGVPVDQLTYTGPVEFDRLRVALGDDVTDYPLGAEGPPVLVASAATLPPASIWADPELAGPTAPTVTEDGRCFGHLALWGTCHIGFQGQCVQPPRSGTGYAYFLVHSVRARDADGQAVTVPVGYGTVGTGHADIRAGAAASAEHYDNTGTAAFEIVVGEDDHGIWFAGRLMPGLDQMTEHKARGTVFSGDWRTIRGGLELVAALGVNTPGFPVPRARVAAGTPLAVVAAGLVHAPAPDLDGPHGDRQVLGVSEDEFRAVLAWVNAQRLGTEQAEAAAALAEVLGEGLTVSELAEGELAYLLESDHPWYEVGLTLAEDEDQDDGFSGVSVVAAGRKVLHLPSYIKRIANHLKAKGMSQSHAIASAVNAAKKMCSSGDLNFPGSQDVNPGSRAQACAAVAEWKKDRPGAE